MRNMRNRGWQRITAGALVVVTCTLEAWAQMSNQDAPMDSIPELVELPDPCNNPTTRMWGSGDELGNMNYLTPERVQENLSLIRLGKIYDLAHILEPGQMGFVSYHDFRSNLGEWPGKGTSGTIFNNEETLGLSAFNPERAGVLYSSNGTQLDGFTHSTQGGLTYNCFDTRDPANHLLAEGDPGDLPKGDAGSDYIFRGHTKQGIENVGTIVARAVLIDLAALLREKETAEGRDPDRFPPPDYEFSPEEVEQALIRQGMSLDDIHPGDALLFRTGWAGRYWTSNPAAPRHERLKYLNAGKEKFGPGSPGLDARAVQWTLNRKPVLVGGDNKSVESSIPGRPAASHPNPGHVSWLNSGIHMLEDLDLEVLAADCEKERVPSCYAFTLIVQTVPIRGAGGSPVAPNGYPMKPLPLFIAVVSFGTIASAQTAETETVRVVLFGSVVATGVYVAHDLGYFTDEGLDVSIEHTPSSKYLVTELVKGTYQIAQAPIDNFFLALSRSS